MGRTKCKIYSRICGYLRPTDAWNEGKLEEFRSRKLFSTGFAHKPICNIKIN